jgi:hypothetical protein
MTQFCPVLSTSNFSLHFSLPVSPSSELRELPRNLVSVLCGSTRTFEQAFSRMKQNKSHFRLRITDIHLFVYVMVRTVILKMNRNVYSLVGKGRPKFHVNKACLCYFYRSVQFCVCYGSML